MSTERTIDEDEIRYRIVLDEPPGPWGSASSQLSQYTWCNYSTLGGVKQVVNRAIGKYNPDEVKYHIESTLVKYDWKPIDG